MADQDCPPDLSELEQWYRSYPVPGPRADLRQQIKARVAVEAEYRLSSKSASPPVPTAIKQRIKVRMREELQRTTSGYSVGIRQGLFRFRHYFAAAAVFAIVLGINFLLKSDFRNNSSGGWAFDHEGWFDQDFVTLEDDLDELEWRSYARDLALSDDRAAHEFFDELDDFSNEWMDLRNDSKSEGVM